MMKLLGNQGEDQALSFLATAQKKPTRSGSIRVGPDFFNFIAALARRTDLNNVLRIVSTINQPTSPLVNQINP
jgi:hypothetical protein